MATRIQIRRDTSANWSSVNPVLAQGEIGFEIDKNKIKIGNGTANWNALPYIAGGETGSAKWGQITGLLADQTDLQTALNQKQPIIDDLQTIINNALAGKNAANTIATYGNVVTHNANEFATAAQGTKADNALPNTTKYAANLNYTNSKLQLRDQDGNVLGSEITITTGGGTWGSITGNLADQTDLSQALGAKQATIDASNKLNAEFIAETTDKKLVSETEKTTWSNKQDAITDLTTIKGNAAAGKSAADTISTYGDVVTHNASEFQAAGSYATAEQGTKADQAAAVIATYGDVVTHDADEFQPAGNYATAAQGAKADTALQPSDILDVYTSTATNKALSANKGKDLNERLQNVEARGRFLSTWDCTTGLPGSEPEDDPYEYKTGDYYIVGTVGTTNYKPTGTSYSKGQASTTVETGNVKENDTYLFDGTSWLLQSGSEQTVTFSNIAGQPTDNTNLASALNSKLPNTTKYGSSISYANNKLQLKDQDGNALGTEQTIVPGHTITYDSTKEEIIFA